MDNIKAKTTKVSARLPRWYDAAGVFALFIVFSLFTQGVDGIMRYDADAFRNDLSNWKESQLPVATMEQAEFVGLPPKDFKELGAMGKTVALVRRQLQLFEAAVGRPPAQSLLQAVAEFERSEDDGLMGLAGESLGDRLRLYADAAFRSAPLVACQGILMVPKIEQVGLWFGICHDLRGPSPKSYPLGRVYLSSSDGNMDVFETWGALKKNAPWLLALFVWINWRPWWRSGGKRFLSSFRSSGA